MEVLKWNANLLPFVLLGAEVGPIREGNTARGDVGVSVVRPPVTTHLKHQGIVF